MTSFSYETARRHRIILNPAVGVIGSTGAAGGDDFPYSLNFEDETAGQPPTNVTLDSPGATVTDTLLTDTASYNPSSAGYTQGLRWDDILNFNFPLPSGISDGIIRAEMVVCAPTPTTISQAVDAIIFHRDDNALNPRFATLMDGPSSSMNQAYGYSGNEGQAAEYFDVVTISPNVPIYHWHTMQAEWDIDSNTMKIKYTSLHDSGSSGWYNVTLHVGEFEWQGTANNYVRAYIGRPTSGDIFCLQVWTGTGSDAWPEGAKV